jgi:hypothetical protein
MTEHPITRTDPAETGPGPAGTVIYPGLPGKVAVVTGASRGIGAATALGS